MIESTIGDCAICFEGLNHSTYIKNPCTEKDIYYHKNCLMDWLISSNPSRCPFCAKEIKLPYKVLLYLTEFFTLLMKNIILSSINIFIKYYINKWFLSLIGINNIGSISGFCSFFVSELIIYSILAYLKLFLNDYLNYCIKKFELLYGGYESLNIIISFFDPKYNINSSVGEEYDKSNIGDTIVSYYLFYSTLAIFIENKILIHAVIITIFSGALHFSFTVLFAFYIFSHWLIVLTFIINSCHWGNSLHFITNNLSVYGYVYYVFQIQIPLGGFVPFTFLTLLEHFNYIRKTHQFISFLPKKEVLEFFKDRHFIINFIMNNLEVN